MNLSQRGGHCGEHYVYSAGDEIVVRRPAAAIRNVGHINASHAFE